MAAPSDRASDDARNEAAAFLATARSLTCSDGQVSAAALLPAVYLDLRKLAAARLRRERDAKSFTPTGLVHDAYLRVVGAAGGSDLAWSGKAQFFAAAALAMRRILTDRARRRRVRAHILPVSDAVDVDAAAIWGETNLDLLALDEALDHLQVTHPRGYEVVMLRFFAGLSVDDAARALDVGPATIKRDWAFARAVLLARMEDGR